jgi:hypothetical protein
MVAAVVAVVAMAQQSKLRESYTNRAVLAVLRKVTMLVASSLLLLEPVMAAQVLVLPTTLMAVGMRMAMAMVMAAVAV